MIFVIKRETSEIVAVITKSSENTDRIYHRYSYKQQEIPDDLIQEILLESQKKSWKEMHS